MAALGLPIVLLAGLLADLAAGAIRRRPLAVFRRSRDELLALWRGRARPSVLDVAGALAAMFGGGLVAVAAIRGQPGTAVAVYLLLVLAAAGAQTAAADGRSRLVAVAAEPAFVLALGASFLRWGAADLDAVRGAHEVIGTIFVVGPPSAAAGAILAALVLLLAGALRLPESGVARQPAEAPDVVPPSDRPDEEAPARPSLLPVTLARWAAAGATALTAAAFVAGGSGTVLTLLWAGVAAVAAGLLGAARELLPVRWALPAAGALTILAVGAVVLVVVAP